MRFALFLSLCLALSMIFTPVIPFTGKEAEKSVFSQSSEEGKEKAITLYRTKTKKTEKLTSEEYLTGVISAEISPLYSDEAIKAQVVAAHTYALYIEKKGEKLTDDYSRHQGYISPEEAKEKWGDKYAIYSEKITSCVKEVKNKIITYDGEIILPAFFALCSGKTENSGDIWEETLPYLVSVTSDGDKLSPELVSEKTVSRQEFEDFAGMKFTEAPVFSLECTDAGAVKKLILNGKAFDGDTVQKAFSLKSNNFSLSYENEKFTFTVYGYGHGVGMSQYGADFMARQGASYTEILKHYYTGTEIDEL